MVRDCGNRGAIRRMVLRQSHNPMGVYLLTSTDKLFERLLTVAVRFPFSVSRFVFPLFHLQQYLVCSGANFRPLMSEQRAKSVGARLI